MVSHALRHEPWVYELELDDEGWVDLPLLVETLAERRLPGLIPADVEAMVAGASKCRHEIVDGRIRALYGHSVPGRVRRSAAVPPDVLHQRTSPSAASVIQVEGLRPMRRQFVHLSVDREGPWPSAYASRRNLSCSSWTPKLFSSSSTQATTECGWRMPSPLVSSPKSEPGEELPKERGGSGDS